MAAINQLTVAQYEATSLAELPFIAQKLLDFCGAERKLITFSGELGAGKTTFIKAFCALLGSKDRVTSPTFSLVNEYQSNAGIIQHLDLYRLKSEAEAIDIGIEAYLDADAFCLIEWADVIANYLPEDVVSVRILTNALTNNRIFLFERMDFSN